MDSTALVEVVVGEVRTLHRGRVLVLASVALMIDGISFTIYGLQVVQTRDPQTGREATGVDLPRYRDPTGAWRPAIDLPDELRQPLGDAVLERCCQLGITKRREA